MKSNEGQVIRAAALQGLGILVQPKYVIYDDVVSGRLVPILDAWELPRLTINLAYASRRFVPTKVRTFIDFLVDHFKRMDFERKWTERTL
jgi:DNA-binding transcriptional LysR family regulator